MLLDGPRQTRLRERFDGLAQGCGQRLVAFERVRVDCRSDRDVSDRTTPGDVDRDERRPELARKRARTVMEFQEASHPIPGTLRENAESSSSPENPHDLLDLRGFRMLTVKLDCEGESHQHLQKGAVEVLLLADEADCAR